MAKAVAHRGEQQRGEQGRRLALLTTLALLLPAWAFLGTPAVATHLDGPTATYTTNLDFDEGDLINVVHPTPGRLELDNATKPFPFIWVAVSSKGTAVKIDTATGAIVGEYHTAPSGMAKDPSRTTVDKNGNVWVSNRAESSTVNGVPKGSVVHIGLKENDGCVDRNGNGVIDTSTGANDLRAWTNANSADTAGGVSTAADECILHFVRVSGTNARHVSVNADNDVWVGGLGIRDFDLVDGDTGAILRHEPSVGCGGYGGLIDSKGVIWSARPLLRWDTSKPLTAANSTCYGHDSYGLCLDSQGNVWDTSISDGLIRKFSPSGVLLGSFTYGFGSAQGCVVDKKDHIWVAHSLLGGTSVGHLLPNGTHIGNVAVGSGPTGVAVDANGKIWATNYNSGTVSRIDPNAGALWSGDNTTRVGKVDLTTVNLGGNPYNYSDMTGSALIGAPNRGTWTIVHDSEETGANWGNVSWTATVPNGAFLNVTAASSGNNHTFGAAQNVVKGADLTVPDGRFLKVTVSFVRGPAPLNATPILFDLTIALHKRPTFLEPSPCFTGATVQGLQDNPLSFTVKAQALHPGATVNLSLLSAPANTTLVATTDGNVTTGTVTWATPVEGNHTITVRATDSGGARRDCPSKVQIRNPPPQFTEPSPCITGTTVRGLEDLPLAFPLSAASENPSRVLRIVKTVGPAAMVVDGHTPANPLHTGVTWPSAVLGDQIVRFRVLDNTGLFADCLVRVSVLRPEAQAVALGLWAAPTVPVDLEAQSQAVSLQVTRKDPFKTDADQHLTAVVQDPNNALYAEGVREEGFTVVGAGVARANATSQAAEVRLLGGAVVLRGLHTTGEAVFDMASGATSLATHSTIARVQVNDVDVPVVADGERQEIPLPNGALLVLFDRDTVEGPDGLVHRSLLAHLYVPAPYGRAEVLVGALLLQAAPVLADVPLDRRTVLVQDDARSGGDAGDGPEGAVPIGPGLLDGAAPGSDTSDYYAFEAKHAEKIHLDLVPSNRVLAQLGDVDVAGVPPLVGPPTVVVPSQEVFRLRLYDPTGSLREQTLNNVAGAPSALELNADLNGTWLVQVLRVDPDVPTAANYSLALRVTPLVLLPPIDGLARGDAPDACTPDGKPPTLQNGVYPGVIEGTDQADVFQVHANIGELLTVALKPGEDPDAVEMELRLRDAACVLLDTGTPRGLTGQKGDVQLVGQVPVFRTGTYFVEVVRRNGVGNYYLVVSVLNPMPTVPNNDALTGSDASGDPAQATSPPPLVFQGRLDDGDPGDAYRLPFVAGRLTTVVVVPNTPTTMDVSLYGPDGEPIGALADPGLVVVFTFVPTESGDHVLLVEPSAQGGGNYLVTYAQPPVDTPE